MNERVKNRRAYSVDTRPYICSERAELLTDFYSQNPQATTPVPIYRAMAFKYILENKTISICEGELIVGTRSVGPKATSTYPELCCHDLEDLRILNTRNRTSYGVGKEVMDVYENRIIPFWKGKTIREKVFSSMSGDWRKAFDTGVFTEFMEQRAPGHAILDDKIYHRGLSDFVKDIEKSQSALDRDRDLDAVNKDSELEAMKICAQALIAYAKRYADLADKMAAAEHDLQRRSELEQIAENCRHVPANKPETFWQGLQSYWFVHLGVVIELNVWDSFNPGRLDRHLYPFYKRQLQDGTLTKEQAVELLQCFWIKFNDQPAPPKVGVTEEQSATYTDFALINVGGIDPDGNDAVNELSYMILDVVEEMRMVQPSSCIQLSEKNPESFLRRACEVVSTGFGQPSIFNTDVIQKEFAHDGKTVEDARAGGPSGCVTISAFGKESCTLTGYMNWAKIFELVCFDAIDPNTGEQVGLKTGDPRNFTNFEQFADAYKKQLNYFVDLKIAGNNIIERIYAEDMPSPMMSLIVDDCIEKGLDYHNGGPRYNPTYIQGVGIGTVTDCMSAIRYHVFENKTLTMDKMLESLENNFENDESLRQMLVNRTPFYGNDDDYADSLTEFLFETYFDAVDGRPNTKGGRYRVNLLPTTCHIYFGSVTGALPNGRKAKLPVSDGISPHQGSDVNGPTAVLRSAGRIDHARTGGTLLNMKFAPQIFDEAGLTKLGALIRTYFSMGGHHIQFNVINADVLRNAQQKPELHRNLIVRVAGYSDYFIDLGKDLQDEIIFRTEQKA